jgi:hypothetical protein
VTSQWQDRQRDANRSERQQVSEDAKLLNKRALRRRRLNSLGFSKAACKTPTLSANYTPAVTVQGTYLAGRVFGAKPNRHPRTDLYAFQISHQLAQAGAEPGPSGLAKECLGEGLGDEQKLNSTA